MTTEIKEIINWLNQIIKENKESDVSLNGCVVPFETLYKLQDYITNLQKTQETLIKNDNEIITNLQEENERLKLNQTKKVLDTIAGLIKNGETCSYRYLIYDLLGFQEKDYVDLIGGLAITNMLVAYEDYKSRNKKAIEKLENMNFYCPSQEGEKLVQDLLDTLRGEE